MAIYATNNSYQPTGSPVVDFGSVTVPTSATGVFSRQISAVTLQPGVYVTAFNASVSFTLRLIRGGLSWVTGSMGSAPFVQEGQTSTLSNSSFPTVSPVLNALNLSTNAPFVVFVFRWSAA